MVVLPSRGEALVMSRRRRGFSGELKLMLVRTVRQYSAIELFGWLWVNISTALGCLASSELLSMVTPGTTPKTGTSR